jgi:transcriptional regulator with XRE-family HTH domain
MKTLAEIVGKNIQTRRIEMGLHQRQLAEMIDAGGQSVISSWEQAVRCPTAVYLYNLADVFGCSVDSLMGRDADA